MTLKIRPAHSADQHRLTAILHRSKASWGYPEEKMENFRCAFRLTAKDIERGVFLVAERDGQPVGFAGGFARGETFCLYYLFIAPEATTQGIGRLLLTRIEDQARIQGVKRLKLESDHFAAPFYVRQGFEQTGTRPSPMSPTGAIPVFERRLSGPAFPLKSIKLKMSTEADWGFEQSNESAISAHWQDVTRKNPHLWNGRTLKVTDLNFQDGHLNGTCQESSFAAFLAWRDWGFPSLATYNLFGSAVLRCSDGALVFGVMADHTANPGKIYPPGGSLEPSDINPDTGEIEVLGSIFRELEEETGMTSADVTHTDTTAIFFGPMISVAAILEVNETAETVRENILQHSFATEEKELKDAVILRSQADLTQPGLQPWAKAIAKAILPIGQPQNA
ncbi:GNAT family N-acetyltransferase [Roseibium sp.]|uniref:GNAT family N-acetyltransferase n=1 Tax=Roseibium sp. TaxID=1936156 RepID=UPI003A973092